MLFLALAAILALVSLPNPSASQGDITLPLNLPPRVISTNQQAVCPPDEVRETARNETTQDTRNSIRKTILPALFCHIGQTQANPAASCSEIPTSWSSKYYWVRSSNGTAVQVYCDTQRMCGCSNTTGWTRVASLNTSDPSQQCPGEWILQTYSLEPRRLCGRGSSGVGCFSAVYSTYGISYNHVCGRVIGYQYHSADAFGQLIGPQTIGGPYVDGVSLTHGPPGARHHVWTFVAGLLETAHVHGCDSGRAAPTFLGNDYCESRNPTTTFTQTLYASDPLCIPSLLRIELTTWCGRPLVLQAAAPGHN